jgi:hypothetical protein
LFGVSYLIRLQRYHDITNAKKIGEAFSIRKKPRFDFPNGDPEN